jgi:hypothetical protein
VRIRPQGFQDIVDIVTGDLRRFVGVRNRIIAVVKIMVIGDKQGLNPAAFLEIGVRLPEASGR